MTHSHIPKTKIELIHTLVYVPCVPLGTNVTTLQKCFAGLCDEVRSAAVYDVATTLTTALTKVQRAGAGPVGGAAALDAHGPAPSLGLKSLGALLYSDAQHTRHLECPVDHGSTLSDWEKHPLEHGQQVYAALDAVLSLALALDSAAQLAELEMGQSPESQSDISEAGSLTCGWL